MEIGMEGGREAMTPELAHVGAHAVAPGTSGGPTRGIPGIKGGTLGVIRGTGTVAREGGIRGTVAREGGILGTMPRETMAYS